MMTTKSQGILDLAARWYVFFFLNVYGLGKIVGGQFYRRGRLPEEIADVPLSQVTSFDLAWVFMGHSFAYILFIGIAEVLGAWLLLWERTKLLGVAILLPIMVNIVVFDIIFLDKLGALASASLYTLLLFVILFLSRDKVAEAWQALTAPAGTRHRSWRQKALTAVVALVVMAVLFGFDQMLVNLLGHGRG